jgi:hypothetical protein
MADVMLLYVLPYARFVVVVATFNKINVLLIDVFFLLYFCLYFGFLVSFDILPLFL